MPDDIVEFHLVVSVFCDPDKFERYSADFAAMLLSGSKAEQSVDRWMDDHSKPDGTTDTGVDHVTIAGWRLANAKAETPPPPPQRDPDYERPPRRPRQGIWRRS
jgi:hypothetical protein